MVGLSANRSGLRRRAKVADPPSEAQKPDSDGASEEKKKPVLVAPRRRPTEILFVVVCLSLTWLMCAASTYITRTRVSALLAKYSTGSSSQSHEFSTPLAMRHIREIGAKPRWIRTKSLQRALTYIHKSVLDLKAQATQNGLDLEIELFKSGPGSFPCSIAVIELLISYDALMSLVVRVSPKGHPRDVRDSLLINAHVDSAAGAPGASDNVVGVGVAMEVLRSMVATPPEVNALHRPVIFLFNGGEEAVLPAAHSFISQHPLAKSIATHINTESLGPGDSYMLFHLGPKNSWLARAFARSVSVPFASVTASDLFEAKVIPGETDFRIFDEVGNIPGFDFAFLDNGFIYHTMYDDVDHVSMLGVQHAGQTVLELSWELVGKSDAIGEHLKESDNAPAEGSWKSKVADVLWKVSDLLNLSLDRENPRAAYFGVLGRFTIMLEDHFVILLNIAALVASVIFWLSRLGARDGPKLRRAIRMLAVVLGTEACALASVTCAATMYSEVLNAKLSWYGSALEANLVFLPPGLYGLYTAMFTFLPRKLNADRVQNMLFALSVFYGVLIFLFTRLYMMTGLLPLVYFAALHLVAVLWKRNASKARIVVCQFILGLPAALFGSPIWLSTLDAFLPIFGRIGRTPVPIDVLAAVLVIQCALVFLILPTLPLLVHFPLSLRQVRIIFAMFMAFSILHVLRSVPTPRLNESLRRETFSTDAPRRLFVNHFHSPQMKPSSVLAISPIDSLPISQEPILKNLNNDKEMQITRVDDVPKFGILNGSCMEPYRAFCRWLDNWYVYQTPILPALALPTAFVKKEFKTGNDFNITIEVLAPESHVVTARFPMVGTNGAVRAWSFSTVVQGNDNNGTEVWVRHVGSEKWTFSVLLPGSKTDGFREKLPVVVSNIRWGIGPSKLLPLLTFAESDSPLVARSTAVEFLL